MKLFAEQTYKEVTKVTKMCIKLEKEAEEAKKKAIPKKTRLLVDEPSDVVKNIVRIKY